jgi:hypothetical protein
MQYFTTKISLLPNEPPRPVVRELLRVIFEQYRWFRPIGYGYASVREKIDPEHIDYDALLAYYDEKRTIMVASRAERDFIIIAPARKDASPYGGYISWDTSPKAAAKSQWQTAHLRQITEIMQLVNSPLVQAVTNEDFDRKKWRLVPNPDGFGQREVYTVRDYSEGLTGVFWRNFFGPPFVRMFGERLKDLPAGCSKEELPGGIVLVQAYEDPSLAGTEEGIARERALIEHLGSECFYDHERHIKPTRLPELPPPPTSLVMPGA